MNMTTLLFTCHGCGLQRVRVMLVERGSKEDVLQFMERVKVAVGDRHRKLSPTCNSEQCDIALPIPKDVPNAHIGEACEIPEQPFDDDFLKSKGAN